MIVDEHAAIAVMQVASLCCAVVALFCAWRATVHARRAIRAVAEIAQLRRQRPSSTPGS